MIEILVGAILGAVLANLLALSVLFWLGVLRSEYKLLYAARREFQLWRRR